MIKPKQHPHEFERLKALKSLNIMDTMAENEFDEITFLASQICGTPIALISLVDDHRQWFKSKVGLSASETPKEMAFCAHAILQESIFEVPDSSKDERFYDNPRATGAPFVQFYAGAPLLDPVSQLPIGTLCVIDRQPRFLTEEQKKSLKALSSQVSRLLDLRVKLNDLTQAHDHLKLIKTAYENISEGLLILNVDGKVVEYNHSIPELLCIHDPQIKKNEPFGFEKLNTSLKSQRSLFEKALQTGEMQLNQTFEIIDEETKENKFILFSSIPLCLTQSKKITHVVSSFKDITQEMNYEKSLAQASRMSSLVEMSGGLAHEINTPLAIIGTAVNQVGFLMTEKKMNKDKIKIKLSQMDKAVHKISQIVKSLKTFAHDLEIKNTQSVELNSLVNEALDFFQERFDKNGIQVKVHLEKNLYIQCIAAQMVQVFVNLIQNSFEAIKNMPSQWINIKAYEKDQSVFIELSDSGFGIEEKLQERLMQPFFSTKKLGEGMGLSLSISKGVVESFQGHLYYDKTKKNTTFVIVLPHVKKHTGEAA